MLSIGKQKRKQKKPLARANTHTHTDASFHLHSPIHRSVFFFFFFFSCVSAVHMKRYSNAILLSHATRFDNDNDENPIRFTC